MLKYNKKRIRRCLLEKSNIYVPSRPLRSRNLLVDESRCTLNGYNEPLLAMKRQFNIWSYHFDFNLLTG